MLIAETTLDCKIRARRSNTSDDLLAPLSLFVGLRRKGPHLCGPGFGM